MRSCRAFTIAACLASSILSSGQEATLLPDYKPSQKVSGTIRISGSPQMAELLTLFEYDFARFQPEVRFEEDLQSTLTAVPAVSQGRADIGLLGREIWEDEIEAFRTARGRQPLAVAIATGSYDVPKATFALMVFVPRANPLNSISVTQLDRVFSDNHPIREWGELGLHGTWFERKIHPYGFEVANDKSRIFSSLVFGHGEHWNPAMTSFSTEAGVGGSDAGKLIVDAVANDPDAIGISNVHYANQQVKTLAILGKGNRLATLPTRANVANRSYPLSRSVYMVVNLDADGKSSSGVAEFLRYVLSRQGQQQVLAEGNYLPLTPRLIASELRRLPAR